MANNRPLTTDAKLEIVEVLKRGNLSHRAIAKQFNRSQSTISAIAREAGIAPTHRRRRTAAAKHVVGTYSREERVAIADRALSVLNDLLSSGGLTPRELREITQALKQTLDARRAEDFPEVIEKEAPGSANAKNPLPFNLEVEFKKIDDEIRAIDEGRWISDGKWMPEEGPEADAQAPEEYRGEGLA